MTRLSSMRREAARRWPEKRRADIAHTLIATAKLNGVGPQAWLTDVPGCIADNKINRIDELLPWRYGQSS